MTTKLVDLDIDSPNSPQLQFQDFPPSGTGGAAELDVHSSHTVIFNHSPDTPGSDSETGLDSTLTSGDGAKSTPSFWTFEYYQQFFDVDTRRVINRILWSMVPRPNINYLDQHIKPKPDLYGPFWICVTLVFTIAVSGNLANYIQVAAKPGYHWKYEFHLLSYAAAAIFSYAWIVPLLLWAVLKWRSDQSVKVTFLEILCVYGYSLAIYVPVSILWVIQVSWVQWFLVILGASLSGSVLLLAFWPALKNNDKRLIILLAILSLHVLLAAGFKFTFFYIPHIEELPASSTTIAAHNVSHNASAVAVSKS